MNKTLKTESEILELLNAELRKNAACENIMVADIVPIGFNGDGANWEVQVLRGKPLLIECERHFRRVQLSLQRQFDLLTTTSL